MPVVHGGQRGMKEPETANFLPSLVLREFFYWVASDGISPFPFPPDIVPAFVRISDMYLRDKLTTIFFFLPEFQESIDEHFTRFH